MKRLGGMQPCAASAEAHMTHLVMGSPRRTLKVQYLHSKLLASNTYATLPCCIDMLQGTGVQRDAGSEG